jgi:hypothetical protein
MKRNSILLVSICAVAMMFAGIAAAQAAKVAGSWDLSSQGRNGMQTSTLTLTQDGNKLTGTLKGARGDSPVTGTVDGQNITFSVTRTTPNGEVTQTYTGTVTADGLSGTVKMGQNDVPWTAKKSAAQ